MANKAKKAGVKLSQVNRNSLIICLQANLTNVPYSGIQVQQHRLPANHLLMTPAVHVGCDDRFQGSAA